MAWPGSSASTSNSALLAKLMAVPTRGRETDRWEPNLKRKRAWACKFAPPACALILPASRDLQTSLTTPVSRSELPTIPRQCLLQRNKVSGLKSQDSRHFQLSSAISHFSLGTETRQDAKTRQACEEKELFGSLNLFAYER